MNIKKKKNKHMSSKMNSKVIAAFVALFVGVLAPTVAFAQTYEGTTVQPEADGKTYNVSFSQNDKVTLNNFGQDGQLTLNFATSGSGSVVVEKSSTVPAGASSAAPGAVDTYYDVTLSGFTNEAIASSTWTFSVTKDWLTQQSLTASNVALYHFENSAWKKLSTTVASETSTGYTLSAAVTGFSPFAVAGTATSGGALANTGAPILAAVIPGVALVAAGAGILIRNRRS